MGEQRERKATRYNIRRHYARSLRDAWRGDDVLGYLRWLFSMSPDYLAYIIDQQTCHMDMTESRKAESGETVRVWECSNCGQEHEEINGAYEFCPHCGAEVVGND